MLSIRPSVSLKPFEPKEEVIQDMLERLQLPSTKGQKVDLDLTIANWIKKHPHNFTRQFYLSPKGQKFQAMVSEQLGDKSLSCLSLRILFGLDFEGLAKEIQSIIASKLDEAEIDRLIPHFKNPSQTSFESAFAENLEDCKNKEMTERFNHPTFDLIDFVGPAGGLILNDKEDEYVNFPQWEAEVMEWLKAKGDKLIRLKLSEVKYRWYEGPKKKQQRTFTDQNLIQILRYCPNLKSLSLPGDFIDSKLTELANVNLPKLESLHLDKLSLSSLHIFSFPNLINLKEIIIKNGKIILWDVIELINQAGLSHLTSFILEDVDLSQNIDMMSVVTQLVQSAPKLTKLHLKDCRLSAEILLALVNSPIVANLKELDLSGNECDSQVLEAIAKSPQLQNLEVLNYNGANVSHNALRTFVTSNTLTMLHTVSFTRCSFDDSYVQILGRSTLPKLKAFNLASNNIGRDGLVALAGLNGLTALDLSDNTHLARSPMPNITPLPEFSDLKDLKLQQLNNVFVLADIWKATPKLETCDYSGNRIQPEGVERLIKAKPPALKVLDLRDSFMKQETIKFLKSVKSLKVIF